MVKESHPLNPLTPYAVNKTSAENIYLYYHRVHGIPCILFRIANPYGPRSQMKHNKYRYVLIIMIMLITQLEAQAKVVAAISNLKGKALVKQTGTRKFAAAYKGQMIKNGDAFLFSPIEAL